MRAWKINNNLFWEWQKKKIGFYTSQFWVRLNTVMSIQEMNQNAVHDHKIYDLFGRKLPEAPFGQLYIQNRKKHFRCE